MIGEIVTALADDSGMLEAVCRHFLTELPQWISLVNKRLQDEGQRYTILPFKLHQFISQTGAVYTTLTLDQDENASSHLSRASSNTTKTTRSQSSPMCSVVRPGMHSSAYPVTVIQLGTA